MLVDSQEGLIVLAVVGLLFLFISHPNNAIGTRKCRDIRKAWDSRGWPLVGDTFLMLKVLPRMLEWGLKCNEDCGPCTTITTPGQRIIFINRPEWIEWAQKTNFPNYEKGWFQRRVMTDLLGGGIFASDGDHWNAQRKTTSRIFSANAFRGIITDAIDNHLDSFVNILKKKSDAGQEIALNEQFFRFTLDTFVRMTFGIELGSIKADKSVPFADAFDLAQGRLDIRFWSPAWQLTELFSHDGRQFRKALKTIDDFSYGIIDERDRRDQGEGQVADEKGMVDLLSLYRNIRDEKGQPMSRKDLRDAVLNLIIAGRDTTAQALSWCFYYVGRKPSLLDPIREEAKRVIPDGKVTYDNYRSLVQANAFFYEVLRLHPSVPKNAKVVLNDDQIPHGGPTVRKNDVVAWMDWAIARDPAVWGSDAKELKPSRFVDEQGNLKQYSSFQAHFFNAGPRLCLGQNLATFEGIAVIEALAKNFDFAFAPGYLETTPMTGDIVDCGLPTPLYVLGKSRWTICEYLQIHKFSHPAHGDSYAHEIDATVRVRMGTTGYGKKESVRDDAMM